MLSLGEKKSSLMGQKGLPLLTTEKESNDVRLPIFPSTNKVLIPIDYSSPSVSILTHLNTHFQKFKGFENGLVDLSLQLRTIRHDKLASLCDTSKQVMLSFALLALIVIGLGVYCIGTKVAAVIGAQLFLFGFLGYLVYEGFRQEKAGSKEDLKEMLEQTKLEKIAVQIPTEENYIEVKQLELHQL